MARSPSMAAPSRLLSDTRRVADGGISLSVERLDGPELVPEVSARSNHRSVHPPPSRARKWAACSPASPSKYRVTASASSA